MLYFYQIILLAKIANNPTEMLDIWKHNCLNTSLIYNLMSKNPFLSKAENINTVEERTTDSLEARSKVDDIPDTNQKKKVDKNCKVSLLTSDTNQQSSSNPSRIIPLKKQIIINVNSWLQHCLSCFY